MKTRAKFRLDSIERTMSHKGVPDPEKPGATKYVPCEMRTLKMSPVYGNGDPNHENTKFWEASPSGSFQIGVVNLDAVEHMKLGEEFYIDITPASAG
jgi:hypothetical protein